MARAATWIARIRSLTIIMNTNTIYSAPPTTSSTSTISRIRDSEKRIDTTITLTTIIASRIYAPQCFLEEFFK